MGALKINKTNGTSTFIDMTGYSSVEIDVPSRDFTTIRCTKVDGSGTDEWAIQRYIAETGNTTWPLAYEAAYEAISFIPVYYGYPNLGNDWKNYAEYDIAKFANSAIDQALDGDTSVNIVYSEKTAIATNAIDEKDADALLNNILAGGKEIETESQSLLDECIDRVTTTPDPFTWPTTDCISTTTAECEVCKNEWLNTQLTSFITSAVNIDFKHQYLFANVQAGGPA